MSTIQSLRAFVNQRLTAAVEEIFVLLETTICNYEAELCRQRKLLEHADQAENPGCKAVLPPGVRVLIVRKEEQQEPEPPDIKEEPEELCVSRNGERLQGPDDITKFPITAVTPVQITDEKTESPTLHHKQSEEKREAEPPASSSAQQMDKDSDGHLLALYYCESETEDSNDDYKKTRDTVVNESTVNHGKSHGSESSFSCTVCDKTFGCKGNLHAHMRSHTGEKPFTCGLCNKGFSAKVNLKTHMRSHTGEKPFSCSICNKSFSQKKTLVIHLRSHTGERPFSCSFCSKSFTEKGALKRHIRIHTGEKPYRCSVCGRNFSLLSHVKSHKCAGASSVK